MEVGQDHHLLSRHRSYERRRQRKQHAGEQQLEENERTGARAVKIVPPSTRKSEEAQPVPRKSLHLTYGCSSVPYVYSR